MVDAATLFWVIVGAFLFVLFLLGLAGGGSGHPGPRGPDDIPPHHKRNHYE